MDFLSAMKAVEQFSYELMSWVFFYPLTVVRVLVNPKRMMDFVVQQSIETDENAYATAMRPALFLLISLTIGALLVPLNAEEIARFSSSKIGKAAIESTWTLIVYRMITFTAFPIIAAIIHDKCTPGQVSRNSLKLPFSQQCYLFAPFNLIVSPSLILIGRGSVIAVYVFFAAIVWILSAEFVFFRNQSGFRWFTALLSSLAVIVLGFMTLIFMVSVQP